MNRSAIAFGLCIAAVAVGALVFRLPRLTMRPMHPDEANQAVRTGILYDTGVYRYDPSQHHGPSLYYLALAPLSLSGAKDFAGECISDGFTFDVETILRARRHGYRVREFPVQWRCDWDSRLRPARGSARMLSELITIKKAIDREQDATK